MQLRRIQTLNLVTSSSPAASASSPSESRLRPCQQIYLGTSNARRMLKRAQLSKHSHPNAGDDPIFALHEEAAAQEALAATAAPFDSSPSGNSNSSSGTGYSVSCYATHTEDAQKLKETAATEKELLVLLNSINVSRKVERSLPLKLKPLLCKLAQEQAESLYLDENTPTSPSSSISQEYVPNVTISTSRTGRRRATLISPPRIGALACGEMWYGGKYRRHLYAVRVFDEESGGMLHPEDCPCHLRMVFETLVDEGWSGVGIGRGGSGGRGRWVVELGE